MSALRSANKIQKGDGDGIGPYVQGSVAPQANFHVLEHLRFSVLRIFSRFFLKPFLLVALLFFCLTGWQSMIL